MRILLVLSFLSSIVFSSQAFSATTRKPKDCRIEKIRNYKGKRRVYVIVPGKISPRLAAFVRTFDSRMEAKVGMVVAMNKGICKVPFEDSVIVERFEGLFEEIGESFEEFFESLPDAEDESEDAGTAFEEAFQREGN